MNRLDRPLVMLSVVVGCGGGAPPPSQEPEPPRVKLTVRTQASDAELAVLAATPTQRVTIVLEWGQNDDAPCWSDEAWVAAVEAMLNARGYDLGDTGPSIRIVCERLSIDVRSTHNVETGRIDDADGNRVATEYRPTTVTDQHGFLGMHVRFRGDGGPVLFDVMFSLDSHDQIVLGLEAVLDKLPRRAP